MEASKEIIELDWFTFIPMIISAIAAWVSVVYAIKSKNMQTQLFKNKCEIEKLNELIKCLKIAKAIDEHDYDFSDNDFEKSNERLNEVPAKIAILIQNPDIARKINKKEWERSTVDFKLENKIESLCLIRNSLF